MTTLRQVLILFSALFVGVVPSLGAGSDQGTPGYFDLGPRLVLNFQGTNEFKHEQTEFVRLDSSAYVVKSSGDKSPSEARLRSIDGYTYFVLDGSGEKWLKLKNQLRKGDRWHNRLRGWNQKYRVVATDLTLSLPAGKLTSCAKVTISWTANEHDMQGPQQIDLYLAPGLGIVKRVVFSAGALEHEEVLVSFIKGPRK